jgi:hypothetical protein
VYASDTPSGGSKVGIMWEYTGSILGVYWEYLFLVNIGCESRVWDRSAEDLALLLLLMLFSMSVIYERGYS